MREKLLRGELTARPETATVPNNFSPANYIRRLDPLKLVRILILAGAYYYTARWGLGLAPVNGYATFVWPPTGIALAALLLGGRSMWPGIFIGALFANYVNGASVALSFCIAIGNTAGPLLGATLLEHHGFNNGLRRSKDVALLVGFSALFSTLVTATFGTTILFFGGMIGAQSYLYTWLAWWVGDALGVLVVAPLLIIWSHPLRIRLTVKQIMEASALLVIFIGVSVLIFDAVQYSDPIVAGAPYLLFSFMIWAAIRFNIRFITALIFILSVIAIWSAKYGHGPFYSTSLRTSLFATQLFMAATAVTFLTLSNVIYERKQAQTTVLHLNKKLQDALAKTTLQLQQERELEKQRDEFVATASHELKTPVTSIKAYAQILQKTLSKKNDVQALELARNINKQSDVLTGRVDELLDVSSVKAGNMRLYKSNFDVIAVISEVVDDFKISANSHTLVQRGISECRVTADKSRFVQVLQNLISNAVKYSPGGSRVIIRTKSSKNYVVISVEDSGPGISKADQKHIFQRFFRTTDNNKSKQSVSGMGLGLFIASEIVNQHGGKLWVESRSGKGSKFIFSLPIKSKSTSKKFKVVR